MPDLVSQLNSVAKERQQHWGLVLIQACDLAFEDQRWGEPRLELMPKSADIRDLIAREQLARVARKCRKFDSISSPEPTPDVHGSSTCKVEYEGARYKFDIGGAVGLAETVIAYILDVANDAEVIYDLTETLSEEAAQ